MDYIRKEKLISDLTKNLEAGKLSDDTLQKIKHILEVGGPRSLLQLN